MDFLISYPKTYPLPCKSAEPIAHSCLITILSDNGTEYRNESVEEICKKIKIGRIYTSL